MRDRRGESKVAMQQVKLPEGKWAGRTRSRLGNQKGEGPLASESDPFWMWGRPDIAHHEAVGGTACLSQGACALGFMSNNPKRPHPKSGDANPIRESLIQN